MSNYFFIHNMMTEIQFAVINNVFKYIDLCCIQCIDDIMKFLHEYLDNYEFSIW